MSRNRHAHWSKIAAWCSLAWIYFTPVHAQTMDAIKQTVRKKFPDVPQISTADLAGWLADSNRPAPLLIDARSREEFGVSHLWNAVHAEKPAAAAAAARSLQQPLVVYCSVGYRSSSLAHELQRRGYTNVFNLEGSIFQWANEGRPVYAGTNVATAVHPFSSKWGKLLKRELHARGQ